MSAEKERLDVLLVKTGMVESRHKAQALIMSGAVSVNDVVVEKAGTRISSDSKLSVVDKSRKFVGRGGDKIDAAFVHFNISLDGVVAVDIGSSTGGFTDCMLQRGASRVYAVDVGKHQLAQSLRDDSRVVVMEETHAKNLTPEMFTETPIFATIDVSFIGVAKILPNVLEILAPSATLLVLVKPQFELGPEQVSKGGVVHGEALQREAIAAVQNSAEALGLSAEGDFPSPLRGEKKGNQEFFLFLKRL